MGGPTSVKLRNRDLHVRVLGTGGCIDHGCSYLVNSGNGKSVTEGHARRARTSCSELVAAIVAIIDRDTEEVAPLCVRDEDDGLTRRRGGATHLQRDAERQRIQASVATRDSTDEQAKEDPHPERATSHVHKDRSRRVPVKNEF